MGQQNLQTPVISFVAARSGSGKTTLLEKVIRIIKGRGYKLAVIKHDAHQFEMDHPGKDTWKMAQAGADIVAISSPEKVAVIAKVTQEKTLDEIIAALPEADIILTEGYKSGHKPKIEVVRAAVSQELLRPPEELLAVASDMTWDIGVPCYSLDDAEGIADAIIAYARSFQGKNTPAADEPKGGKKMRKAVIVFTKVPQVGDIKTRLTKERGGILTPEEAKDFYEAFLLDVIEACIAAESGDVWICYNQAGDRKYFDEFLKRLHDPGKIKGIFADRGGTFDECIQYAADYILKNGAEDRLADALLIIGGDLPGLQPAYIQGAFAKMEQLAKTPAGMQAAKQKAPGTDYGAALVEGSCQEGGFSIVGFTCNTPFDFRGVFYNQEGGTALDMLVGKADELEIPFGFIQNVPDVDIPVDLASVIPELGAIKLAARYDPSVKIAVWTTSLLEEMGLVTTTAINKRDHM